VNEAAESITPDSSGPGAQLASRREARRLTVEDIAGRLKFAARQIQALEADQYERLPGPTFVRGMIRGYARLLETDPAPMLHAFEQRYVAAPVSVDLRDENIPFPDGRPRATRIYLALSVIVVGTMAAVLYEGQFGLPSLLLPPSRPVPAVPADVTRVAAAEPSPVSDAPAPAAESVPAPVAGNPAADSRMVFEFHDESWVEVKDRNGRTLLSQINRKGTRKVVDGDPPFVLVIGNASKVDLRYRNEPVDLRPHTKVEVARMILE
jgi:cytoskeleton protein RodZ